MHMFVDSSSLLWTAPLLSFSSFFIFVLGMSLFVDAEGLSHAGNLVVFIKYDSRPPEHVDEYWTCSAQVTLDFTRHFSYDF